MPPVALVLLVIVGATYAMRSPVLRLQPTRMLYDEGKLTLVCDKDVCVHMGAAAPCACCARHTMRHCTPAVEFLFTLSLSCPAQLSRLQR